MFNTNFSNNRVKDICVGTFNVRTLKSRLSRLEFCGEMDILYIHETKYVEYEELLLSCGSRCIMYQIEETWHWICRCATDGTKSSKSQSPFRSDRCRDVSRRRGYGSPHC